MRHRYIRKPDKVQLGKTTHRIYAGAIRVALEIDKRVPDSQRYTFGSTPTAQAFYFAEQNRAGALTFATTDRRARDFAHVPDTLLRQERHLKQARTACQQQLQQAQNDSVRRTQYEDRLFVLNQSYDSLVRVMEQAYPRYHTLKYRTQVHSLPKVQAQLSINALPCCRTYAATRYGTCLGSASGRIPYYRWPLIAACTGSYTRYAPPLPRIVCLSSPEQRTPRRPTVCTSACWLRYWRRCPLRLTDWWWWPTGPWRTYPSICS